MAPPTGTPQWTLREQITGAQASDINMKEVDEILRRVYARAETSDRSEAAIMADLYDEQGLPK